MSHSGTSPDSGGSSASDTMRAALERELRDPAAEAARVPPPVADHTLSRRIGRGAYGDVWLARNALGAFRAVKVVYRARFDEDRPYEREFNGILKYEPISRSHEGLVQVLHVGRGEGCFYYVMELADDTSERVGKWESGKVGTEAGAPLSPAHFPTCPPAQYVPRTLRHELARHQRLPPAEAARLVLRLVGALAHLHAHGLVHRDIKPSNVIFVRGQPKLADIGLVTDVGSSQSFVGTEGFIPPEGPGTTQADLYGLGKLLYELATGRDRMDFPQLPSLRAESSAPRVPLSPQRGEGLGVRGENVQDVSRVGSTLAASPLTPALSPLRGEGAEARRLGGDAEALLELNEVMTRACAPDPKQRYASATEFEADLNLFLAGHSLRHARNVERTLARLKKFAAIASFALALAAGAIWFVKNEERHANERARQATERARVEADLRQRAESAEHAAARQLYTALLEQARATVRGGELGQRVQALDALRRAAAISNSAELRREAMAALALPDLRFERELALSPDAAEPQLDPAFVRMAVSGGRGPVEIRAVADNRVLATLPASTNLPVFVRRWSPDGRFLAVKRDYPDGGLTADWEVWDVAAERRVMLLRGMVRDDFNFHPRLPRCVATHRTDGTAIRSLDDGRELVRLPQVIRPHVLRFSPEGDRLAAASLKPTGYVVSIHDALHPDAPEIAVSRRFTAEFIFEWHPGGRWLAVLDMGNAVHWMDAETGELGLMGRHKSSAVNAEFSPDGDWLFTGGWERELICWDALARQRAFGISLDSPRLQISADGRRCAVATRSHLLWHAFERPAAHREFAEDLGGLLRHATFSPDGRWLAASANERVGLWDLAGGGPGAISEHGSNTRLFFTPDSGELFATRRAEGTPAAFRWRITPATNAAAAPVLTRLPLRRPRGFTSLAVSSNLVVLTGTNGTQVLAPGELETGATRWSPTHPGINGVSPDGRWLGIYRSLGNSLYIHRLPGLERVAKLTQASSFGDFQFSPLGDEVAIGSTRTQTRVDFWSTTTWERTRTLTNFGRLLYTPDARGLWLTKDQRTAGLYDARTLEPRLLLPIGMLPLAVSADGRHLAVSVEAQRLQVWDMAALREQFRALGLDWAKEE